MPWSARASAVRIVPSPSTTGMTCPCPLTASPRPPARRPSRSCCARPSTDAQISGNGFGKAFHLTTDLPVVAYQMLPFGGGRAAATGASLLLPTSAWGDSYIAVSAYDPPPGSIMDFRPDVLSDMFSATGGRA